MLFSYGLALSLLAIALLVPKAQGFRGMTWHEMPCCAWRAPSIPSRRLRHILSLLTSNMRMATRTVAQVRLALCQRHVAAPAAVSMTGPCPASYQKIAFKTRHVASLSASRYIYRAGRAAFATQVIQWLRQHAKRRTVPLRHTDGHWIDNGSLLNH